MSAPAGTQLPPAAPPPLGTAGGDSPQPRPPARRGRRRAAAGAAFAAVAGAAAWVAIGAGAGEDGGGGGQSRAAGLETATVERRTLVEREDVDGTLGYAGSRTVAGQGRGGGTITRLPAEGSTVRRGEALLEVDGRRTGWLLYGRRPAWRGFESGMSDGEDVRQLEASLKALGHDPYGAMTVDDEFTDATAAAIERFEEARGLDEDGRLDLGEVVFLPGEARISERKASVGSKVAPGQPILETTTTRKVVTVQLEASRQSLVRRGQSVEVELPDGDVVRGRIARISRVARPGAEDGAEATVEVTVRLRGRTASRGLDRAPVTVGLASDTRRRALSVPVTALLALEGGGMGVEVVGPGGRRRTIRVEPGLFADGYVEVSGRGLREGMRVVVPDEL